MATTTSPSKVRWIVSASIVGSLMVVSAGSAASLASSATTYRAPEPPAAPEMIARIADQGPCPKNMALVGSSCVDKYEGSLVEIHEDGSETEFSPYQAPNGHHVRAVSRPGVV